MKQTIKKCKKCGIEKSVSEFYKCKTGNIDCLRGSCKKCSDIVSKKSMQKWNVNNPGRMKERVKKWRKNNLKKVKISSKRNSPERRKEYNKAWRKNNPEKVKEYNESWTKNNPEKRKEYTKLWRINNREKFRKSRRIYMSNRKKVDIHFKVKNNFSSLIRARLKKRLSSKKSKSTFSFLPYTVDDLIKHLETQFDSWMNWQNYGNQHGCWNIDHIYPDSKFNYKSIDDKEFQECWALKNLQPLERMKNIKKGAKIMN